MTVRQARAALVAMMAVASAAAGACGNPNPDDAPWARRVKPASYQADSTRIVALATHALGDSIALRADMFTRGAQGWQVRLLPVRGGTAGGGMVWVDGNDSTATVVKRY